MTELAVKTEQILTTYSLWATFRNCRRKCDWRYNHKLVSRTKPSALYLGSTIHDALADWYQNNNYHYVQKWIDDAYPNRDSDPEQKKEWHLATAMMRGYIKRYPTEDFEVVDIERIFKGPIVNPTTKCASRTFVLAGKVDAVVRHDGRLWLMEHKTASTIDEGYLEKLWGDFQTVLYAHYLEREYGEPVAGVLYNVLQKIRLRQYQVSSKRKTAETNDEFQERLTERYASPDAFHRQELFVDRNQIETLQYELWELTQNYLEARRRGVWYQNTDFCWHYNRPCAYWKLCRTGGSDVIIESDYEVREPHEELRQEAEPF